MTNCAPTCRRGTLESYQDAVDSLTMFAASHPEWRRPLEDIVLYVETLRPGAILHEPGL
jgi:hypothetical protein